MNLLTESFWIAVSFVAGIAARLGVLATAALIAALIATLAVLSLKGLNRLRLRAGGLRRVGSLWWHPELFFSPAHTWVKRTSDQAVRIGLDDLAGRICVGLQEVTLPAPGTHLKAGEPAITVRIGKRAVSIASPLSGTVLRANQAVRRDPSVLKREPYSRGWLLCLAPDELPIEAFRRGHASKRWLHSEEARLNRFFERELAVAAADGGDFILPAPSLLSDQQWAALTRAFLAPA